MQRNLTAIGDDAYSSVRARAVLGGAWDAGYRLRGQPQHTVVALRGHRGKRKFGSPRRLGYHGGWDTVPDEQLVREGLSHPRRGLAPSGNGRSAGYVQHKRT